MIFSESERPKQLKSIHSLG